MDTKVIVNVSDGSDVANAIDLYVNSFGCPGKHFYNAMLEKSVKVQHNFTLLCVEWFADSIKGENGGNNSSSNTKAGNNSDDFDDFPAETDFINQGDFDDDLPF